MDRRGGVERQGWSIPASVEPLRDFQFTTQNLCDHGAPMLSEIVRYLIAGSLGLLVLHLLFDYDRF
jgi:hypothetical protein